MFSSKHFTPNLPYASQTNSKLKGKYIKNHVQTEPREEVRCNIYPKSQKIDDQAKKVTDPTIAKIEKAKFANALLSLECQRSKLAEKIVPIETNEPKKPPKKAVKSVKSTERNTITPVVSKFARIDPRTPDAPLTRPLLDSNRISFLNIGNNSDEVSQDDLDGSGTKNSISSPFSLLSSASSTIEYLPQNAGGRRTSQDIHDVIMTNNYEKMTKEMKDRYVRKLETISHLQAERKKRLSEDLQYEAPKIFVTDFSSTKKWMLAFSALKLGLRLALIYKTIVKEVQTLASAPSYADAALTTKLKGYGDLGDMNLSRKVKNLLSDPPASRKQSDIEELDKLLANRLKAYARYNATQRIQFCSIMTFQAFPTNTLIIKQEHVSTAFYFLLGGRVEVFKIKDGAKMRVAVLNSGSSFGDRTMKALNDKRTACVGSITNVELLCIDKRDYFDIVMKGKKDDKTDLLDRIPLFREYPFPIERAALFFKFFTYEKDEIIQHQDTQIIDMHWIIQGTCRVVGTIPFMSKKPQLGRKTANMMRGCAYNETPGFDEIYTPQELTIHNIEEGSFFPSFPDLEDKKDVLSAAFLDKQKYRDFFVEMNPEHKKTWNTYSIIANRKCLIASIQFAEFINFASPDLMVELIQNPHVADFSISQIQQAYISKMNWDNHKKMIVKQIRG